MNEVNITTIIRHYLNLPYMDHWSYFWISILSVWNFLKICFPFQPEVLEQLSGLKEFWMDGNRLTLIPGVSPLLYQIFSILIYSGICFVS